MKEAVKEVTQEMIEEWKNQHGRVFRAVHPDVTLYYRLLTRDDYISIMQESTRSIEDPEIRTVKKVALNDLPESLFTSSGGGAATVLHDEIMKNSGFIQIESEEL